MASTPSTFKVRFPEFVTADDTRIQMFLDDAADLMGSVGRWCSSQTKYDVAQCYLAAHYLTIASNQESGDNGVIGPISKQEVDDVLLEQAVKAADPNKFGLDATAYGQRYLQLRHQCFGAYIIGV